MKHTSLVYFVIFNPFQTCMCWHACATALHEQNVVYNVECSRVALEIPLLYYLCLYIISCLFVNHL